MLSSLLDGVSWQLQGSFSLFLPSALNNKGVNTMRAPQFLHVQYTTEHRLVTLEWVTTADILDSDWAYCSDPVTQEDLDAYADRVRQEPTNTVLVVGDSHADLVELAEAIINLPNYLQARILDTWMNGCDLWRAEPKELEAFVVERCEPFRNEDESGFCEGNFWATYFPAIEHFGLTLGQSVRRSAVESIVVNEMLRQRDGEDR